MASISLKTASAGAYSGMGAPPPPEQNPEYAPGPLIASKWFRSFKTSILPRNIIHFASLAAPYVKISDI